MTGAADSAIPGQGLSPAAARAALRKMVTTAAGQAHDEAGFFARLRADGVLVRLRFSDLDPEQVTGYSVGLPGHDGSDGTPAWYGGGRLAAGLTLPRLRRRWGQPRAGARNVPGRSGSLPRNATRSSSTRRARPLTLAEHIRRCARDDPDGAADAARAAADTLHVAARALRNPELRRAADSYDRAARARYGAVPARTRQGNQLRQAARLMAMTGALPGIRCWPRRAGGQPGGARRRGRRTAGGPAASRRRLLPRAPLPGICMPPPAAACGYRSPPGRRPGIPGAGRRCTPCLRRLSGIGSARTTAAGGRCVSRPAAHRGPLPPRRAGPRR